MKIYPLMKPITADVVMPGSKSYTNRAIIMAAMAKNKVHIISPLISDDTKAMVHCLQSLGIRIEVHDKSIDVLGSIEDVKDNRYELDANLSGTTLRFILPLLAIIPGVKILKGKEELNKRPINVLVDALRQMGAEIEYLNHDGYPPLRITSSTLKAGSVTLDGSISSQYFSALLMIAPIIGGLSIDVKGEQISKPYIDMTIDTMKKFGVTVANNKYRKYIVTDKQSYKIKRYIVEGDFSSAGYFFAIAALTKSTLTLKNLNPDSVQADKKVLHVLEDMGSKITYGKNEITIQGAGVKAVTVNMIDFPDQAQTLAVLAAFAKGTTNLTGIQSLRIKETERVTALENELKKMGIHTVSTEDTLIIHGGNLKPAMIDTYGDHRMAMSFAIAGTKLSGIEINDPGVVSKTFPNFWEKLNSIGINTEPTHTKNIVLIGMRGSGKSTVASLLSKKINRESIELDDMIIKKVGLSIPMIVAKFGWDYFRDQETAMVDIVSSSSNKILSTGGGVILRIENIEALKKNGLLILLTASVETLVARTARKSWQPALTANRNRKKEIMEVLNQRKQLYHEAADKIINTDGLKPDEVVQIITSLINKK